MYASSSTMEVNPKGSASELTVDQVWQGLLSKARNPVGIVPGAHDVEIPEEYPDGFLRRMSIGPMTIIERITLSPKVQVLYTRVNSPGHEGFIANTLGDFDGRLVLTFTVEVSFPGTAAGSADERDHGHHFEQDYRAAMKAVLDRARNGG